jgi:flagellar FliL protein
MSGAAAAPAEAGAEDANAEAAPKKGSKKKVILLALPVLLLALGGGLWFSGILPKMLGMGPKPEESAAPPPAVRGFFELPEIIVNLNAPGRRPSYLKLRAKLEIADTREREAMLTALPRLLDLFNTYLREMRPEELRGSAGTHRLREELLARANLAVAPARVTDILFTEMLVQ